MIRQTERWLTAARQDLDPGVRFLHASYGIGVVDILRQVARDDEIRVATGADVLSLLEELGREQDLAQAALLSHPSVQHWSGR